MECGAQEQEKRWDISKMWGLRPEAWWPEAISRDGAHSDMWSLGCLVYIHIKSFRKISGSGVQERGVWPGVSHGWHQGRDSL